MKQDSRPIVTEIAQAARVGLNELDRAVEAFGACIADAVPAVVPRPR